MVTIIGNGIGEYNFLNIQEDLTTFNKIVCDKNFTEVGKNILKLGFKDAKEYILKNYNQNIVYIVTGSPLFFSAGTIIASKLPKDQVKIINNTSCKDYLLTKLFIDETKVNSISLHGRINIDKTKFLTNQYTLILCDKYTIDILKEVIKYLKKDDIDITIGYKLGYKDELIEKVDIYNLSKKFNLSYSYILLIKKLYTEPNIISCDDEFEKERGMITKKYKRELSLQALDLKPNEILWDVGAGSGSCGIQAYKRYRTKTIFFEKQLNRIDIIKTNLTKHKVIDCTLFEGEAQDIFDTIKSNPNKIFLGGGGVKVIEKIPYLYDRLEQDGIILINAITLTHLSLMITILNKYNIEYSINSISLTSYKGKLNLVEPQRELYMIVISKK